MPTLLHPEQRKSKLGVEQATRRGEVKQGLGAQPGATELLESDGRAQDRLERRDVRAGDLLESEFEIAVEPRQVVDDVQVGAMKVAVGDERGELLHERFACRTLGAVGRLRQMGGHMP